MIVVLTGVKSFDQFESYSFLKASSTMEAGVNSNCFSVHLLATDSLKYFGQCYLSVRYELGVCFAGFWYSNCADVLLQGFLSCFFTMYLTLRFAVPSILLVCFFVREQCLVRVTLGYCVTAPFFVNIYRPTRWFIYFHFLAGILFARFLL